MSGDDEGVIFEDRPTSKAGRAATKKAAEIAAEQKGKHRPVTAESRAEAAEYVRDLAEREGSRSGNSETAHRAAAEALRQADRRRSEGG